MVYFWIYVSLGLELNQMKEIYQEIDIGKLDLSHIRKVFTEEEVVNLVCLCAVSIQFGPANPPASISTAMVKLLMSMTPVQRKTTQDFCKTKGMTINILTPGDVH